jgi:hypothetical protein
LTVQGHYRQALERIEQGLRIGRERKLSTNYIQNRIINGEILALLGFRQEVFTALSPLLDEVRGQPFEGQILMIWASVGLHTGEADSVRSWLGRARQVLTDHSVEDELVGLEILQCRLHQSTGAHDEAVRLANSALVKSAELHLVVHAVEAELVLSELLLDRDVLGSSAHAVVALQAARGCGMPEAVWRLERLLGCLSLKKGDVVESLEWYSRAFQTLQEISPHIPTSATDKYFAHDERRRLFLEVNALRSRIDGSA